MCNSSLKDLERLFKSTYKKESTSFEPINNPPREKVTSNQSEALKELRALFSSDDNDNDNVDVVDTKIEEVSKEKSPLEELADLFRTEDIPPHVLISGKTKQR